MAVTTYLTNRFKYRIGIKYTSSTVRVVLVNSSYVFDQDNHNTYSDISAYIVSSLTYQTSTLAGSDQNNILDKGILRLGSVRWTLTSGTVTDISGAIIYSIDSGNPVLGYINFGEVYTLRAGNDLMIQRIEFSLS